MTDPEPGPHVLVASTGGHLAQLNKWSQSVGSDRNSLWVTFMSAQSESLLGTARVLYVPYVAPRDIRGTVSSFVRMMRHIDWESEGFTAAISTGAAVGLAGLAAARIHRVRAFYIESVSRVNGPSLTGRLVSLDRGIETYCQYQHWATARWKFRGSLFDSFETEPKSPSDSPRMFITLGTIRPYRFDAMVDAILSTGLADGRTVWQLGETTRHSLPGKVYSQLGSAEFDRYAREADVVITHAGVGTIMHLLEMGIFPIVVPRRAKRNEHIDNHQLQIAELLKARGISLVVEVDQLERGTIVAASALAISANSR